MKKKHTGKLYAHLLFRYQQYFRIRVLFSVILTIGLLSITQIAYAQSSTAKVSLKIENGQIKEALKQIESQTDYLFVYNSGKIDLNKQVTINVKNRPLTEIFCWKRKKYLLHKTETRKKSPLKERWSIQRGNL